MIYLYGYAIGVVLCYLFALIVFYIDYKNGAVRKRDDAPAAVFFAVTWPFSVPWLVLELLSAFTRKLLNKVK